MFDIAVFVAITFAVLVLLAYFQAPILLFHGDADRTVPVATSDRLAEVLPHLVTYVRIPGAGHVQGWNVDRERYVAAVRTFLTRVLSDERLAQASL